MKHLSVLGLVILFVSDCYGQNSYPGSGPAVLSSGVDINLVLKDARSGKNWNYVEWQFSNGSRDWLLGRCAGSGFFSLWNEQIGGIVLQVNNQGQLGLGTTPNAKLHLYEPSSNILSKIETGGASTSAIIYKNSNEEWQVGNQAYGATGFNFATGANIIMNLKDNGNVGIGTTNPGSFKLAVNGKTWTTEVQVAVSKPPDYVFEPTYHLSPLDSIKTYIDKNKHLPEVPSAKEMEKNGVNLGEMNMLLLKKIEELTLYVIELKKENEIEKLNNKEQSKQIEELKQAVKK